MIGKIVEKDTSKGGGERIERDVFLSVSLSVLTSWPDNTVHIGTPGYLSLTRRL